MIPASTFKRNLRNILHQLSSAEYQQRVWERGEGPEVSSFVEAVCGFDEMSLVEDKPISYWKKIGFTDRDISALLEFAERLEAFQKTYPDMPDDKVIVADPNWAVVRQEAADLLKAISHVINTGD